MKNIILTIAAVMTLSASANTIVGVQILKGTIKQKMVVNTVKTTCKVKVEKVKNLMLEDSYGNPAYNVRLAISLDGDDVQRNLTVRYSKDLWFNNLFTVGTKTEVRDLDYVANDGSTMKIDGQGRIKNVSFGFQGQKITCSF